MIVVVNKIDLVPDEKRADVRTKMQKGLTKMLSTTVFKGVLFEFQQTGILHLTDSPIVFVSACVGADATLARAEHLDALMLAIRQSLYIPPRRAHDDRRFAMQVDHCFAIKGQGTVMTGGCARAHARLHTLGTQARFCAAVRALTMTSTYRH